MNVTTFRSRVFTLLQPIIGGVVIWADQTTPRPQLPFTSLRLDVVSAVGESFYGNTSAEGVQSVNTIRECVLAVHRYGVESVTLLADVAEKLQLSSNTDKFGLQQISLFNVSDVTDLSNLLNGVEMEPRAMLELNLRWNSEQLDNVGLIETIDMSGDIEHAGAGNGNANNGVDSATYVGPEYTALNQKYPITIG